MKYEEIYSRSYMKRYDPDFYTDKEFAYETMKEWMSEIASLPYVRKIFSSITLNDDIEELTYELKKSIDKKSDDNFVKKIFSDGFVICWMQPQVDSKPNCAIIVGGNQQKRLQSNYKSNIDRLTQLKNEHQKLVRDYGYSNGVGTE